jgi:cytidylate kinase
VAHTCKAGAAPDSLFDIRGQTYNPQRLSPDTSPSDPSAGNGFASVIAIDGPVASGKSAVGRKVAEQLGGYRFVDTGMMYRAITWLAIQRGVDLEDEEALAKLAREVSIRLERGHDGSPVLFLNNQNVTSYLREPEIDRNVPHVSEVRGVRQATVPHQRAMAAQGRLVMVGRDIGSEVLPTAPVKVFLTATAQERARRRHAEMQRRGDTRSLDTILEEVKQRDYIDENRDVSPLLNPDRDPMPEGTEIILTDDLTEDEVVERICEAARQRR